MVPTVDAIHGQRYFSFHMKPASRRGIPINTLARLALMPAAAFATHQLRYWLAWGGHAGVELQRQGHAYLHSVVPWIIVLIAGASGVFLRQLGRAFTGKCSLPRYTLSFAGLWLACAASLIAIYIAQELLEGFLVVGHPAGFAGVFAYGGWWSIPAAACVGLVLAAILHGARWVVGEVARRHAYARIWDSIQGPACRPRRVHLSRRLPLADGWSGRGPPLSLAL